MTIALATQVTAVQPQSIGNIKIEIMDVPIVSGNTGATATALSLYRVDYAILSANVVQTAVPTYATNVATFTFTDPVATVKGQCILFGR